MVDTGISQPAHENTSGVQSSFPSGQTPPPPGEQRRCQPHRTAAGEARGAHAGAALPGDRWAGAGASRAFLPQGPRSRRHPSPGASFPQEKAAGGPGAPEPTPGPAAPRAPPSPSSRAAPAGAAPTFPEAAAAGAAGAVHRDPGRGGSPRPSA